MAEIGLTDTLHLDLEFFLNGSINSMLFDVLDDDADDACMFLKYSSMSSSEKI